MNLCKLIPGVLLLVSCGKTVQQPTPIPGNLPLTQKLVLSIYADPYLPAKPSSSVSIQITLLMVTAKHSAPSIVWDTLIPAQPRSGFPVAKSPLFIEKELAHCKEKHKIYCLTTHTIYRNDHAIFIDERTIPMKKQVDNYIDLPL